ncbi:MAG TPA: MFS transporter [Xanthobacteraceae bacterium]|nr:MFS transporter [Xanthobacteraceae bacterium]
MAEPEPAPRPALGLVLLAVATAVPTFSMHVLVPALPAAARALDATPAQIQLTVSLYLLGLAFGQILHGPLSDRIGRRPVILGGFAVYLVGTIAAFLAPSLPLLLAARVLQSLGSCAGLVVARAAIRESSSAGGAAAGLAVLTFTISLSSAVAPLVGSAIELLFGWRMIFVVLLVVAGALTALLHARFAETNLAPSAGLGIAGMARSFARLGVSPVFLGYSLCGAAATVTVYAFYAALPFLVAEELPGAVRAVAFVYLGVVSGSMVGALAARRASRRIGLGRMTGFGVAGTLLAALAFLAGRALWPDSLATIVVPLFGLTFAGGFVAPAAATLAMGVDRTAVGAGSSLYGFIQMALGALVTLLVGLFGHGSLPVGAIVLGSMLAGAAGLWVARRAARPA